MNNRKTEAGKTVNSKSSIVNGEETSNSKFQTSNDWIPAPRSESRTGFAGMTDGEKSLRTTEKRRVRNDRKEL